MSLATRRMFGTLTFSLALAAAIAAPSGARAAAIVYDTSGLVGTTGISGTNAIRFEPISKGSFTAPSSLSLGTFVVSALPDGETTTYNHTPFAMSFAIKTVDGVNVAAAPALLTITGFLNGTLTGSNLSTVIAQFDPIPDNRIVLGPDLEVFVTLPSPQRTLGPATTLGGQSSAEAFVTPKTIVPEPTSIALFAAVAAGLGWHRLRRQCKATAPVV